jgi:hypothetical protein
MKGQVMDKIAYIIVTEYGVDCVEECATVARNSVKELRGDGFSAKLVKCPWDEQDDKIEEINNKLFG